MTDEETLQKILKMTQDNNRMLHAMRRNSFLSAILRLIVWAAFIIIPLWLYAQYIAPVMQSALETMSKVQGTGAQAQVQLQQLEDALKKMQSVVPSFGTKQQ